MSHTDVLINNWLCHKMPSLAVCVCALHCLNAPNLCVIDVPSLTCHMSSSLTVNSEVQSSYYEGGSDAIRVTSACPCGHNSKHCFSSTLTLKAQAFAQFTVIRSW